MKRVVFGILISILMISSILASANTTNYKEENDKQISLFEIEDGEISVTIPLGAYEITQSDQGDEVTVEDFGRLLIPGKPNLPSKIFSVAIPPGAIFVDFTYDSGEGIVLGENYDVKPVPSPIIIGQQDPEVYEQMQMTYDENYQSTYATDDTYPASVVDFVQTAGYRKYNLVDLRVNPFAYRPISGQLTFYPEITITISYIFSESFTYDDIMIDNVERAEQIADKIVYNYDQAKEWYPETIEGRETYDYVIITLDSLTSYITDLVDWEEAKGRSVNVVTTSWISSNYNGYDLTEKIRNFLRDKYPSEEWGILDVCIVGHWDDVPIRTCWQFVSYYGPVDTDLYYAELSLPDSQSWDADGDHRWGEDSDPIDFYSEINVGRIPWSDPSIVEDICDKSVAYEMTDDPSFKKNILLLAAFFWNDDPLPRTDNAVLMEAKVDQDWMSDWTMTRMYEEAQSNYDCDYDLNYNNVKTVWSQGSYAFVDWAGHGSPTACYEYFPSQPFVDTDTCNYLNDVYPAIIFADACSNSDTDYLNIGQAMLKQGAVGFLGSTEVALGCPGWDDPYDGSSQSLDYFFTTCVTSGDYTQGEAHQWALLEMYTNGLWDYTKYEMFQWGALWGNPDLTMAPVVISDPPETPPKPDGPTNGAVGFEYTFSSSTTDPNGDQIYYMWDWGDGNFSEWMGLYNSGDTCEASYTWNDEGYYDVKVKAKDENGAQSNWSEAQTIHIIYNYPPDKPKIEGPYWLLPWIKYNFKFSTTEPDNEDIYYWIDWGDGNKEEWIGTYSSGEIVTLSHRYTSTGVYKIKAKAKDTNDLESEIKEKQIQVKLSRNRMINNPVLFTLIEKLIERFPMLEWLLVN